MQLDFYHFLLGWFIADMWFTAFKFGRFLWKNCS